MQSDSDILHYTARSLSSGSLASGYGGGGLELDYKTNGQVNGHNGNANGKDGKKQSAKAKHASNLGKMLLNSPLATKAAAEVKPVELKYKHYKDMLCYEFGTFCCFLKFLACGTWRFYSMRTYMIILSVMVLASSMIVGGYLSAIITSLQTQYNMSTSKIGFILSSFDIMGVVATPLLSYVGSRYSKPRLLGKTNY
jgi:hypothetical protein